MLAPYHYNHNEIVMLDLSCINNAEFEKLTDRGVVYVTKNFPNIINKNPRLTRCVNRGFSFI